MADNKHVFSIFILISILFLILSVFLCCIKYNNNNITEIELDNTAEQIEPIKPIEMFNIKLENIQELEQELIEDNIEMVMYFNEDDVIALAKVLYNECRGIPSDIEKACVGWAACNRVDAGYGNTIYEVLTAPNQFAYWNNTPITEELYNLATDVLTRWNNEKNGIEDVGRVLQSDYLWFRGDGKHNYFRDSFSGKYNIWDYSLANPYEN